jgi:hypothetical protein
MKKFLWLGGSLAVSVLIVSFSQKPEVGTRLVDKRIEHQVAKTNEGKVFAEKNGEVKIDLDSLVSEEMKESYNTRLQKIAGERHKLGDTFSKAQKAADKEYQSYCAELDTLDERIHDLFKTQQHEVEELMKKKGSEAEIARSFYNRNYEVEFLAMVKVRCKNKKEQV